MVMVGGIANLLPLVAVVVDVERGDVACEKRIAMTAADSCGAAAALNWMVVWFIDFLVTGKLAN
jgi:hypothetical protein